MIMDYGFIGMLQSIESNHMVRLYVIAMQMESQS